jgi:DNA-binding transcriptional LysR family regulator
MIRFSFRQLTYFLAAAEHGSTQRAAEVLGVSQPSISIAVKQLEHVFAQQLFVRRHAQGLTPSPFGRQKLAEVRSLLAQATALSGNREAGPLEGDLEVGIFSTLAPAFAPGVLRHFRRAHPNVTVRLREDNLDQLRRDLHNGIIELALLYDLDIPSGINRSVIGEFEPYVALPAAHSLSRLKAVPLRDVAREPFVLIDLPGSRDFFMSLFRMADVMPAEVIRCGSLEMVRGMVANGHGLSILVTRPHSNQSYDGQRLVCRPIAERVPVHRVVIASAGRAPLSRIARAFVETSQRYARQAWMGQPGNRSARLG